MVAGSGRVGAVPVADWRRSAACVWNGAFGGVPSIYQSCAVRADATSPELAGAWVNATANVGIGGGAAIGAGLLHAAGLWSLPWAAAALVVLGLAVILFSRRAFPLRVAGSH